MTNLRKVTLTIETIELESEKQKEHTQKWEFTPLTMEWEIINSQPLWELLRGKLEFLGPDGLGRTLEFEPGIFELSKWSPSEDTSATDSGGG